jgi:hypothetical protein
LIKKEVPHWTVEELKERIPIGVTSPPIRLHEEAGISIRIHMPFGFPGNAASQLTNPGNSVGKFTWQFEFNFKRVDDPIVILNWITAHHKHDPVPHLKPEGRISRLYLVPDLAKERLFSFLPGI